MDKNESSDNKPMNFLDDEAEEGVSYIQPNVEIKLPAHKRMECREIVKEIKNFGVNQRQILYTIYLLALELENVETMKAITKVVGENRDNIKISSLIVSDSE